MCGRTKGPVASELTGAGNDMLHKVSVSRREHLGSAVKRASVAPGTIYDDEHEHTNFPLHKQNPLPLSRSGAADLALSM